MGATFRAALVDRILTLRAARDVAHDALVFLAAYGLVRVANPAPYVLLASTGTPLVRLRPINEDLYVADPAAYLTSFAAFEVLLADIRRDRDRLSPTIKAAARASRVISRTLYTTQQAMGCAMDLLLAQNDARKNYGSRYEDLMKALIADLGLAQREITFRLPYATATGATSFFTNQVDAVISSRMVVNSTRTLLDPVEVVTSIKTSGKDRVAKVFLDQEMLSFVSGHPVKVVGLFHNDVQRSGANRVSGTFVAGNFAAYVGRFGPLTGVYYVDPPAHIGRAPWSGYLRRFEDLLLDDLWTRIF